MRLLVRGQDIGWSTIGLTDDRGRLLVHKRLSTRPETILNAVLDCLDQWGRSINQIDSVAAVVGPGSATALRTCLTMVNTMAYVRGWKVAGVKAKAQISDLVVMRDLAKKSARVDNLLIPIYERAPNITKATRSKVVKSR